MYGTEAQARETATRFPNTWAAIAILAIPDDGRVRIEQTGVAGHWTVWAQPDAVIQYVVTVIRLYDWDDANLIATFTTESAALTEVAEQMRAFGRESVMTWTLLRSTPDGLHKENVAQGEALADRAEHRITSVAD